MYIQLLMLFVILFMTFLFGAKKEWGASLFHTVFFIVTLWINIPCFFDTADLAGAEMNLKYWPLKLNNEFGIIYMLAANIVLCGALYLQSKFLNNDLYTKQQIKKKYDKFSNDALTLYIIGKDIDFLGNKKYKEQTDRIKHLQGEAKLLCEYTTDKKLIKLYKEFCEQGVDIRFYTESDKITNLKGQIKIDQDGNQKAIFVSKQNTKYKLLSIENQFLIAAILERFTDVFKKADRPESK